MNDIRATGNGWAFADGKGVYINDNGVYSSGGSASASFTAITTTGNADHGFYINGDGVWADGAGSSATLVMDDIVAGPNGWGSG